MFATHASDYPLTANPGLTPDGDTDPAICLARDGLLAAAATVGTQVRVYAGTVWVTLHGNAEDYILSEGANVRFPPSLKLIAQAIGGSATFTASPY